MPTEDALIPHERSAAVTRGLRQAFGVETFEDICLLTKGLSSALVFRIVVRGTPYPLRIITRPDAMSDPTRQFKCMQAGAEAGLAPRVCYTSIEDRISITDFVEAEPFPATEALVRMPAALRILHALPPFPKAVNYFDAMDGFVRRFQAANILPKSETEEHFIRYEPLAAIYPRDDSEMVSCHNDLKPENILFDGRQVWLVDWEAAFLNDRYADLSVVANFVLTDDADEIAFLRSYFGHPPDEYQLARFFLMRQMMHMSYSAVFLFLGASGQPVDLSEMPPEFKDFHRRIWAGEVNLGDNHMKIVYGRVHWNRLLENMRQARFDEALRIVSARMASSSEGPKAVS